MANSVLLGAVVFTILFGIYIDSIQGLNEQETETLNGPDALPESQEHKRQTQGQGQGSKQGQGQGSKQGQGQGSKQGQGQGSTQGQGKGDGPGGRGPGQGQGNQGAGGEIVNEGGESFEFCDSKDDCATDDCSGTIDCTENLCICLQDDVPVAPTGCTPSKSCCDGNCKAVTEGELNGNICKVKGGGLDKCFCSEGKKQKQKQKQ